MTDNLEKARDELIQELGRLSSFAGFNKALGQIYALLYLSQTPVSLGEIADQLRISKGNASLNMNIMARWGLIHRISRKGDRRDYYEAETDFWKIIRDIMSQRDKKEIDRTLDGIDTILDSIDNSGDGESGTEVSFYRERLSTMLEFGRAAAQMMQAFLTLENFRVNSLLQDHRDESQTRRIDIDG